MDLPETETPEAGSTATVVVPFELVDLPIGLPRKFEIGVIIRGLSRGAALEVANATYDVETRCLSFGTTGGHTDQE